MLEKARQAERLIAEQAQAQEKFERFRTAVQVRDEIAGLTTTHPSPNPLPVLNQVVLRLRGLDETIRDLTARLEGEVDVHFQVDAPEPTWRITAGLAVVVVIVGIGLAVGGSSSRAPRCSSRSGRSWRSSGPSSPCWPAASGVTAQSTQAPEGSWPARRSTGGCAAGPRWSRSSSRPRPTWSRS